jgi:hypothetical protein
MPEVQQPNIERPFLGSQIDEPFNYYYQAGIQRVAWIRFVADQLDIDASKYILGEILRKLEGDDNYFGLSEAAWRNQPEANTVRDQLMGRIQWKLEIPETPEEIKARLTHVKEMLAGIDWSKENNYQLAKTTWTEIQQWISNKRKTNPAWNEAVNYSSRADRNGPAGLAYHWHVFLYGSPPPQF